MFYTIDNIQPAGKTILLRADLNVPRCQGRVLDESRIQALLPTLQRLQGAKVVVLSHYGRPLGKVDPKYSLRFLHPALQAHLSQRVSFCAATLGEEAEARVHQAQAGEVILLENLRFHSGEEHNDPHFAQSLAALGDIFINDAFSVSHRAHASVSAITKFLPSYAGYHFLKEFKALSHLTDHMQNPAVAIVGGAKVSSKFNLLISLVQKFQTVIVGGGMANTFLKAQGCQVGKSLVEETMLDAVKDICAAADRYGCKIMLPQDVRYECPGTDAIQTGLNIPSEGRIGDIGPLTQKAIFTAVKDAKTVVWNGPLGIFERDIFQTGTLSVIRALEDAAKKGAYVVAGGGETVAALSHGTSSSVFSYVSTSGGAFLEWLEGKALPGVTALTDRFQSE